MIGVREPSWSGYLRCIERYDDCASASVACEVTDTRKRLSPAGACSAGAIWVGVVEAIRVRGSATGGTEAWAESGDSDSGALPAGAVGARVAGGGVIERVAAVGLPAGAGAAAGGAVPVAAEESA